MPLPSNKIEFIIRFCEEFKYPLLIRDSFQVCGGNWRQVPFSYGEQESLKDLKQDMLYLRQYLLSYTENKMKWSGVCGTIKDSNLFFFEVK